MRSSIFILLACAVALLTSCADERHLTDEQLAVYRSWHTGQSYYQERPFGIFLVNRNDTLQEEFIKDNGMLVEFGIAWENDSVYELSFKQLAENPQGISLPDGIDTLVKRCKLTQVTDTSYVEVAYSNMSSELIETLYLRPKKKKAKSE